MKVTSALLAALIAAASAAPYTPPSNQADGAYHVTFNAAGEPITRCLSNLSGIDVSSNLQSRQAPMFTSDEQVVCMDRDIPSDCTYQNVQNCLGSWLDANTGRLEGNDVYYCRSGDTLLALCNYAGIVYGGSSEVSTFNGIMGGNCSPWRSGYVFIPEWQKTYWRTTWARASVTTWATLANKLARITTMKELCFAELLLEQRYGEGGGTVGYPT